MIDAATSTVTTTIPVGSTPASIAINRSGTVGYVANYGSNSISVLDLTTNAVVSSIAVNGPSGIVINPAETRLYVSSGVNRTVSILDARSGSLVAVVPLADAPMGLAADPAGNRLYVLYALLGTIAVIDTATNAISTSTARLQCRQTGVLCREGVRPLAGTAQWPLHSDVDASRVGFAKIEAT